MVAIGGGARRAAGALEAEVLTALWTLNDEVGAGRVQKALTRPLAYTTVLTILNRLVTKGLVERHARGATHTYVPVVSESTVAAGHFEELLDRGADRRAVLQGLVQAISDADAVVLRDLLRQSSSDSKRGDGGSS